MSSMKSAKKNSLNSGQKTTVSQFALHKLTSKSLETCGKASGSRKPTEFVTNQLRGSFEQKFSSVDFNGSDGYGTVESKKKEMQTNPINKMRFYKKS